jgi:hypothetical protein
MKYLLMIYESEAAFAKKSEAARNAEFGEYIAFGKEFEKCIKGGDALQPVHTATTVRIRDGKTLTTDGPFAETREQLGGYYLIDAKDLDEAVRIAQRIPAVRSGSIEVRPVMDFSDAG